MWNNNPDSIGINIFGNGGNGTIAEDNPGMTRIDTTTGTNGPADAAIADGFTVTMQINSDDTYVVQTSGLTNDYDQNLSGAMPGDFVYSDLGNTTFAVMTTQRSGTSPVMSVQVDSVLVTNVAIPEPSSLFLAVIGLLGLLGWGRRRRRSSPI